MAYATKLLGKFIFCSIFALPGSLASVPTDSPSTDVSNYVQLSSKPNPHPTEGPYDQAIYMKNLADSPVVAYIWWDSCGLADRYTTGSHTMSDDEVLGFTYNVLKPGQSRRIGYTTQGCANGAITALILADGRTLGEKDDLDSLFKARRYALQELKADLDEMQASWADGSWQVDKALANVSRKSDELAHPKTNMAALGDAYLPMALVRHRLKDILDDVVRTKESDRMQELLREKEVMAELRGWESLLKWKTWQPPGKEAINRAHQAAERTRSAP